MSRRERLRKLSKSAAIRNSRSLSLATSASSASRLSGAGASGADPFASAPCDASPSIAAEEDAAGEDASGGAEGAWESVSVFTVNGHYNHSFANATRKSHLWPNGRCCHRRSGRRHVAPLPLLRAFSALFLRVGRQ